MKLIFTGICFIGAAAGMIFEKSQDLVAGLTIAILVSLVILLVYSLARIHPQKPEAEKDTNK